MGQINPIKMKDITRERTNREAGRALDFQAQQIINRRLNEERKRREYAEQVAKELEKQKQEQEEEIKNHQENVNDEVNRLNNESDTIDVNRPTTPEKPVQEDTTKQETTKIQKKKNKIINLYLY